MHAVLEDFDIASSINRNLFVKPDLIFQNRSSFKINIDIQKRMTRNNPEARTVIKLLKVYRNRNCLNLSSLIIEQCVMEALTYNNYGVYYSPTENLLNCMAYIAKKMDKRCLRDVANTNNNLFNKISDQEKTSLSLQLSKDIERIDKNPRYIMEIFRC